MSSLAEVFGNNAFDVNSVEPTSDFDVLPPGKYPVLIEKSVVKTTKKNDGAYLELTMTVLEGQFKNRKLWSRINVANPSSKCVEIGRRELSALGRATGVAVVNDENQFLGKACVASVVVKDNQNVIRTYSAMVQQAADTGAPAAYCAPPGGQAGCRDVTPATGGYIQPTTQQPQPTAVGAPATPPPWARK